MLYIKLDNGRIYNGFYRLWEWKRPWQDKRNAQKNMLNPKNSDKKKNHEQMNVQPIQIK